MRLDKFLQITRLVRRRALANSLCHAGRVALNGRPAGPASPVRPGDIIIVEVAGRRIRARVRVIPEAHTRTGGEDYCEVLEESAEE